MEPKPFDLKFYSVFYFWKCHDVINCRVPGPLARLFWPVRSQGETFETIPKCKVEPSCVTTLD